MQYSLNQLIALYPLVKTHEERESIMIVILADLREDGQTDKEILDFLAPNKDKKYRKYLQNILDNIGYCDDCLTELN